ncbi:MAG: glutaredoxin [Zetaproteobacteria bacterium CG2_30_46_52]|nr:MAG: glutaredoxin [Zetaproteobacteria bacterium CG2_30_46_52]
MIKAVLLKIFREGVGGLMAFVSYIFSPRKVKRDADAQKLANEKAASMSMYQYFACPFCIKTRRTVRKLNVPIEYRDAQIRGGEHRNTLEREGGKIQVPCLRIDDGENTTWLYDSKAITAYLNQTFDPTAQASDTASV